MFPLKRLEEEVNIISINPQRSAAAPSPHTSLSGPSIVFISPFLKWLSVCRPPPHVSPLSSSASVCFYMAAAEKTQIRGKACINAASKPLPDEPARCRSVREVWRFYDSFMEPAAVYKLKCRRCGGGGGEVTSSHFTNQAETTGTKTHEG